MKLVYSLALLASAGTAVAASGGYSFTEELQHDAGSLWTRATTHPFTAAIASGEMDEVTMSRYLIQDHKFLDRYGPRHDPHSVATRGHQYHPLLHQPPTASWCCSRA